MNEKQKDLVVLIEKFHRLDAAMNKADEEGDSIEGIALYTQLKPLAEAIDDCFTQLTEEEAQAVLDISEEELNSIKKERSKWRISNLFKDYQKL